MTIGGFQRFSLSEFPGRIAAIVFTRGCNLRCPYCHNPELVDPARFSDPWPEEEALGHLARRAKRLQGVVITGGEPTLQVDLEPFIRRVRDLGLAVKLDTNGTHPDVVRRLLAAGLLCHVGVDVKAPPARYRELTRSDIDADAVVACLKLVVESGIPHEVRTTFVPDLLSREDMLQIACLVRGSASWAIQRFVPSKALDPELMKARPPSDEEMESLAAGARALGVACTIR